MYLACGAPLGSGSTLLAHGAVTTRTEGHICRVVTQEAEADLVIICGIFILIT